MLELVIGSFIQYNKNAFPLSALPKDNVLYNDYAYLMPVFYRQKYFLAKTAEKLQVAKLFWSEYIFQCKKF